MNIKDFGGEFKLIQAISKMARDRQVIKGIGDDCAVIEMNKEPLLISVDTIVEGDHFSFDYFKPKEIGIKAMHSSLSDIAAMGGKAKYVFVAMNLHSDISVSVIKQIYNGMYEVCDLFGVDLLGGDTTRSKCVSISVVVMGISDGNNICYRSDACIGDLIKVTGALGASTAGLKLFSQKKGGHSFVKKKHTQPKCRLDISLTLAKHCNAMQGHFRWTCFGGKSHLSDERG